MFFPQGNRPRLTPIQITVKIISCMLCSLPFLKLDKMITFSELDNNKKNYRSLIRVLLSGLGIFLFDTVPRLALGPIQPPIQWVLGALSLGVKRPGHETDHSPPSSAEVKNASNYTSTPQYAFMAWC
jgi:hypothetical protein